jgi:hypothetical protein
MINILLGGILVVDAILSLLVVEDKRFLWQLGRVVRLVIGVHFLNGG